MLLCECVHGVKSEILFDTGLKNFGTGAESQSEKVTPATSGASELEEALLHSLLHFTRCFPWYSVFGPVAKYLSNKLKMKHVSY